jgi:cytochrome c biogenesis protein CcmG, thiol:disulfide interchange protein DsbE
MSKRFLPVLILGLLILVEGLQIKLKPRLSPQRVKQFAEAFTAVSLQGKLAPAFELQETGGQPFKLTDYVGTKVIVLNFFTTWCGPCRDEMPELERYYQTHQNTLFLLLAIDCNETAPKVRRYFQQRHLTFPVAVDFGSVRGLYKVTAYPTTVVIGIDGRVQLYLAGAIPNAGAAFDRILAYNQTLLGSKFAITPQTHPKGQKPVQGANGGL